jgi:hypothetical protein
MAHGRYPVGAPKDLDTIATMSARRNPAICEIRTTSTVERPREVLPPKKSATPHNSEDPNASKIVIARYP